MAQQLGQMSAKWIPGYAAEVLTVSAYADIWSGIGGTKVLGGVPVVAGAVTADRNSAIRRTVSSLTFSPDAAGLLLPVIGGTGALYPTGNEIQLYKGIIYANGTKEYASLGRFLIQETDVNDDTTGITFISTLNDRANTIQRAAFSQPYSTDGVSTTDVMIQTMISGQVSGLTYSFTPSTYVPPVSTFDAGNDAWTASLSLASAAGMELFFDYNGVCVLQPIQNPLNLTSLVSYLYGSFAAPVATKRTISNNNIPNVIVATSSGSGVSTPLQTYWWDNNPASMTFYASGTPGPTLPARDPSSRYPTCLVPLSTSVATTLAQLQAMANAAGLGYLGTIEGALISLRDQPAHDVNDVITLFNAKAGIYANSNFIVDKAVIDMTSQNALQLTTRLVA